MLKLTLKRAFRGFVIGMAMCNIIAYLISAAYGNGTLLASSFVERMGSFSFALLVQTLLSGVYGAITFAGMSFYDIEHWNMLQSALVHFGICMAAYIPLSLFLGWFSTLREIAVITVIMAAVYFIIWLCISLTYKFQVGKLNAALQKKQAER